MTPMQKKLNDALKKKFYRFMDENEKEEVSRKVQEDSINAQKENVYEGIDGPNEKPKPHV
jgi:hypothetical protein